MGQYHHQRLYNAAVIRGLAYKHMKKSSSPVSIRLRTNILIIPSYSLLKRQILALESHEWTGIIAPSESTMLLPSMASIWIEQWTDLFDLRIRFEGPLM